MGLGGIGISELMVVLVIVVLLFGTKRLGSLGSDLGNAIRGFRKAMRNDETSEDKRLPGQDNDDTKDGGKGP
jgi:sec-independent protein translocase protein TatA